MVELNSTPEIVLKKRKNADRLRIEKQEQARHREELSSKKKSKNKSKFIRAETLVARNLASKREQERVKRVFKVENEKINKKSSTNLRNYIEKINSSDGTKTKELYTGKPTLYFMIRVNGPYGAKIPPKAFKILSVLKLTSVNTGIFIKLTEAIYPLLKLISPYVIIGKPSLASVRQLLQKRATVTIKDEETKEDRIVKLNDNNLIEEKLGDDGIICVEDIIHEIISMGENFKKCTHFLNPFQLSNDIYGYGPIAKLQRLEKLKKSKENKTFSNSGNAPILEIDIDEFISQQN